MTTVNELTILECRKHVDHVVSTLANRIASYLSNIGTAHQDEAELAAPQTIEAYRNARSAARISEKRVYLLEQQLEAAQRSNGIMVEQMHADRDRAAALSAELDKVRAEHKIALALVQTALDAANRKVEDLRSGFSVGDFVRADYLYGEVIGYDVTDVLIRLADGTERQMNKRYVERATRDEVPTIKAHDVDGDGREVV